MNLIYDKYAIGLQWGLFDSQAAANRSLEKGANALLCGKVIHGKQFVLGSTYETLPQGTKTAYSAALVICQSHPTFIVLHEIDNGQYWFCAASNSEPLAENDVVCSYNEAMNRYTDLVTGLADPVLIGDIPNAVMSLHDVLGDHVKPPKHAKLAPPRGNLVFILLLAAILIPLIGGGSWFIHRAFFSGPNEDAMLAMQQALLTQQQMAAEAERQASLKAAIEASREALLNAVSPSAQWAAWYQFMTALPISVNGWKPESLACTPDQCAVTWGRMEGVYPSSASSLPGAVAPVTEANATTVVSTFPISVPDVVTHPVDTGFDVALYLNDLSIETRDVQWSVQPLLSELFASVDQVLLTPEMPPPTIGREGSFSITSPRPVVISEYMNLLNLPGVFVTTLTVQPFNLTQQMSMVIEGKYRAVLFEGQ